MWVYWFIQSLLLLLILYSLHISSSKPRLFATKNCYQATRPLNIHIKPECQLLQVNAVFRHGTRNPGKKDILRCQAFHLSIPKLQEAYEKFEPLLSWTPKFCVDHDKDLTTAGVNEMTMIGKSYSLYFEQSNLLKNATLFLTSDKNRTIGSCQSFLSGFKNRAFLQHGTKCKIRNDLMRFFDECKKYNHEVENNEKALKEVKLFRMGKEIELVISSIKQKLNLNGQSNVTYSKYIFKS